MAQLLPSGGGLAPESVEQDQAAVKDLLAVVLFFEQGISHRFRSGPVASEDLSQHQIAAQEGLGVELTQPTGDRQRRLQVADRVGEVVGHPGVRAVGVP